jgi:AbrB family looped-hinge helix DNA binding protein
VDQNGRIVLPAEARRSLGVKAGDTVIVEIEANAVRLRTFGERLKAAQAVYRKAIGRRKVEDPVELLKRLRRNEFWPE